MGVNLFTVLKILFPAFMFLSNLVYILSLHSERMNHLSMASYSLVESMNKDPNNIADRILEYMIEPMRYLEVEYYESCDAPASSSRTLTSIFSDKLAPVSSQWINSCIIVLDQSRFNDSHMHVFDIKQGYLHITQDYNPLVDSLDFGCPLFQIKLFNQVNMSLLHDPVLQVFPKAKVSDHSIFSVSNKFKYLISNQYWPFNVNRAYYASERGYTIFFHLGGTRFLHEAHPWFLKPLAARLVHRHSTYAMFIDMDAYFPTTALQNKLRIEQYIVPEMEQSDSPVGLIFGAWKGLWINTGVWIGKRSRRMDQVYCKWYALGMKQLPHHKPMVTDQVAIWQILFKSWHNERILPHGMNNSEEVIQRPYQFHTKILKTGAHDRKASERIFCDAVRWHFGLPLEWYHHKRIDPKLNTMSYLPGRRRYGMVYVHPNKYDVDPNLPIFHCMQCYGVWKKDVPISSFVYHTGHLTALIVSDLVPIPEFIKKS